jgi:hypothetical protein
VPAYLHLKNRRVHADGKLVMKTYGEWCYSSTILNSALDGCEWLVLLSGCFTPGEIAPITRWISGLVSPRSDLESVEESFLQLLGIELRLIGHPTRLYTD